MFYLGYIVLKPSTVLILARDYDKVGKSYPTGFSVLFALNIILKRICVP